MANRVPDNFAVLRQQGPTSGAPQPEALARAWPSQPPTASRVAVIVCHGMGQQIPFETIDTVARVLRRSSPMPGGTTVAYPQVTTRIVDLGIDKPVPLKLGLTAK